VGKGGGIAVITRMIIIRFWTIKKMEVTRKNSEKSGMRKVRSTFA
jgi:hypothetical protein